MGGRGVVLIMGADVSRFACVLLVLRWPRFVASGSHGFIGLSICVFRVHACRVGRELYYFGGLDVMVLRGLVLRSINAPWLQLEGDRDGMRTVLQRPDNFILYALLQVQTCVMRLSFFLYLPRPTSVSQLSH